MILSIKASERVFFVGTTGSGKTQLAKYLLSNLPRVLVIDPKHTFSGEEYSVAWKTPALKKEYKIIVRPVRGDDEKMSVLIEKLARKGNICIYVDELSTITDVFPDTLKMLEDIARTGREKNCAVWCSTQRPRWTPKIFMTEAEHLFSFRLRAPEDKEYMKAFMGKVYSSNLPPFHFYYSSPASDEPVVMTLDIENKKMYVGKEE